MNGGKKSGDVEDSASDIAAIRSALENLSRADLLALAPDFANVLRRTSTEWWWLKQDVFQAFERSGFHITQAHYYSPLPDAARLPADLWNGPRYLNPVFAPDAPAMLSLFGRIASFASELTDIPRTADSGYYWDNEFFPNFDAIVYYGLCRQLRPAIVLEIGAGFSTHIALRAADRNGATRVRCIEPYPSPVLRTVAQRLDELIVSPIQDVPMDFYRELRSGDILFVDTSHVSKAGSDLHHILFQILPALPGGVIIHFHDIFLPREYPRTWIVERNWFWNEQYLLLAFLMFNAAFRVMLLNNHFLCGNAQAAEFALRGLETGPLSGASLWLRKEEDGGAGGNPPRF